MPEPPRAREPGSKVVGDDSSAGDVGPSASPLDSAPPVTRPGPQVGNGQRLTSTLRPPVTQLDEAFVLAERVFLERLEERARRATLLTALLRANGLSRDQGIRAVQAALGALALGAEDAQVGSLAA